MKLSVFHHFIFASFPPLFIFLDNINEIPFRDLFLPLITSVSIIVIFWSILTFFFGQKKSALISTLIIFMIILFAYVRSSLIYADMLDLRMFSSNYILIPIFGFFGIVSDSSGRSYENLARRAKCGKHEVPRGCGKHEVPQAQ